VKICPVGAELFACGWKGGQRDGRTDGQTDTTKPTVAFRSLLMLLKQFCHQFGWAYADTEMCEYSL